MTSRLQAITIAALYDINSAITETHPGFLIGKDSNFHSWLNEGLVASLKLIQHVKNENDAFSVLNHYVVGFKDSHLTLIDNENLQGYETCGWVTIKIADYFIVQANYRNWPIKTPPVGSQILAVNHIPVVDFLKKEISPYFDARLELDSTWYRLAPYISIKKYDVPVLEKTPRTVITIRENNGNINDYPLVWNNSNGFQIDRKNDPFHIKEDTVLNYGDGIFWVKVGSFFIDEFNHSNHERFIKELSSIHNAKYIIFDTRGNNGGYSQYGYDILKALGITLPSSQNNTYAKWRISPTLMNFLERTKKILLEKEGMESSNYIWFIRLYEKIMRSHDEGEIWVIQDDDHQEIENIIERGNHNSKFILLTDAWCASACLDFADAVLSLPRVSHVGLPTNADSIYMESGSIRISDKYTLYCPMKIWINRLRGDNQPYFPKYIYKGDIKDDKAVYEWVNKLLISI